MSAPKVLCRTVQFTPTRDGDGTEGDGLSLSGYAAVFGVKTRINSWEGTFDEEVRKGAFRKTLRENTPVMQFDHGRHPLIGSIPIGTYDSLAEDDNGLVVEGRLSDNWLIQPVRDAIASKAVKGMSFRFEPVRDQWRDNTGAVIKPDDEEFWRILWRGEDHERGPLSRELIEVRMPEAGPVVFPAYTQTTVSVRAAEVARSVLDDEQLSHEVRSALALGPRETAVDLPVDPELRRDIARAILFGTGSGERTTRPSAAAQRLRDLIDRPAAPPARDGHPETEDDNDDDTDVGEDLDDAPADGHPPDQDDDPAARRSSQSDAPPAEGHPSPTDQEARQMRARLAYVTRQRVGKR